MKDKYCVMGALIIVVFYFVIANGAVLKGSSDNRCYPDICALKDNKPRFCNKIEGRCEFCSYPHQCYAETCKKWSGCLKPISSTTQQGQADGGLPSQNSDEIRHIVSEQLQPVFNLCLSILVVVLIFLAAFVGFVAWECLRKWRPLNDQEQSAQHVRLRTDRTSSVLSLCCYTR